MDEDHVPLCLARHILSSFGARDVGRDFQRCRGVIAKKVIT